MGRRRRGGRAAIRLSAGMTSHLDLVDDDVANCVESFQDAVVEVRRVIPEFDADAETDVIGDGRAII